MLQTVAEIRGGFRTFAPYVAAAGDDGAIAFWATREDGTEGVFVARGASITRLQGDGWSEITNVLSHPDINAHGVMCFYARLRSGATVVMKVDAEGALHAVAKASGAGSEIGPLGPTINAAGAIAYRAKHQGRAGVYCAHGSAVEPVATTDGKFAHFFGLPVIDDVGRVVFRADLRDGRSVIELWNRGRVTRVVETGAQFAELGQFPTFGEHGDVIFCASRSDGSSGCFAHNGEIAVSLLDQSSVFARVRGVLAVPAGGLVYYAQAPGAPLAMYHQRGDVQRRILGVGQSLDGGTISEFALNPVSNNAFGDLAIRLRWADGRQAIVRANPSADAGTSARLRIA